MHGVDVQRKEIDNRGPRSLRHWLLEEVARSSARSGWGYVGLKEGATTLGAEPKRNQGGRHIKG